MNLSFLVISYTQQGFHEVNCCVNSIRNFYENNCIYIVDNNINQANIFPDLKNVTYINPRQNLYEFNSILYLISLNLNYDYLCVLHDSSILLKKFDINYQDNCYLFWKTYCYDWSPAMNFFLDNLKLLDITYDQKIFNGINGMMGIFSTNLLNKIKNIKNIYNIKINNKWYAVSSELLFGYIVQSYLNIKMIFLYDKTLDFSIHNNDPGNYVKKIGGGKGNPSFFRTELVENNSPAHPLYQSNVIIDGVKYLNFIEYNKLNGNNTEKNLYNYYKHIDKKYLKQFASSWPYNVLFQNTNITINTRTVNFHYLCSYYYFNL